MKTICVIFLLFMMLESIDARAANVKNDFFKAICDSADQIDTENSVCKTCPSVVAPNPPSKSQLEISNFFSAHLSAPDKTETLVVTQGCSRYGGTFFLRETAQGLQRFGYESGLNPGTCRPFMLSGGREGLICDQVGMHFGTIGYGFEQITLAGDHITRENIIGEPLRSNSAGGALENGYCYSIAPQDFEIKNTDAEQTLSIAILASKEKEKMDPHVTDCEGTTLPETKVEKSYTLLYNFDGTHFSPTPDTKKALVEMSHFLEQL